MTQIYNTIIFYSLTTPPQNTQIDIVRLHAPKRLPSSKYYQDD